MSKKIGTHNGSFHADEALACHMLRLLPEYKDATIIRTRDAAELAKCDIVVDVGGVYDHAEKRYDHHQREFKDTFSPKHNTRLSSAGLVYKHYGKQVIARTLELEPDSDSVDMLYNKVYSNLIEGLDGIDNGINQYPSDIEPAYQESTNIASLVSGLNPWWNAEVQNFDEQFLKAVEKIGTVFDDKVAYYGKSWLPAREIVERAFEARFEIDASGKILLLGQFCPWESHLYDIEASLSKSAEPSSITSTRVDLSAEDKPLYVVFADSNGSYRVRAISSRLGSFENRKPLPESWRGLRDEELSKVTGIDGCVFVHSTGFIGGNATKDGALAMAVKAVNYTS